MKSKHNRKLVASVIILFIANVIFFLTIWLLQEYDNICFDQFLYSLKTSLKGTDNALVISGFFYMGGLSALLTLAEIGIYLLLSKKIFKKYSAYFVKTVLPLVIVCLILSVTFFDLKINVVSYAVITNTNSDFFEDNYIKPDSVNIKFPEKKRNLVFIFAESMENTYASVEAGGQFEKNRIPELCELAKCNVNFSNSKGLGGGCCYDGTTWTAGSMFSATAGITVKVPVTTDSYSRKGSFLPNVVTLGDILYKNGYNQTIIMGSDAEFANRDLYFENHGNYNVIDVNAVKKSGRLPQDYKEWWGFEDQKLFEFAKEELLSLSSQDKPFNLTLLTADSHFPEGYICKECEDEFPEQYSNVLRCSSKRIAEFVNWIKQQSFYEDTTVIIVGDHLTMDPEFLKNVSEDYERTCYNCFINPAVSPQKEKERKFATFDLMPTTLAALGVQIEGERLGLGTNLFADTETLTEKYSFDYVNEELTKKSRYYNEYILDMK